MSWALVRLSFRQSVLPALGVMAAILTIVLGLEWAARRATGDPGVRVIFDLLLVAFVLWSGFLVGARLFAREFRERHVLLVHVLPLARSRAWASMMLGGAAAGAASLGVAALVRAPLSGLWDVAAPDKFLALVSLLLAVAYLVLFAAGSCFALLVSGTAVHAVGFVATFATLGEAGVLVGGLCADPRGPAPGGPDLGLTLGLASVEVARTTGGLLVFGALALVLYLGFSLLFFLRGEFPVVRVRRQNVLALAAGHVLLFAAAGAILEAWAHRQPFVVEDEVALSNGGRYLAVVERRHGYPRLARMRIVDTANGRLAGTVEADGLRAFSWSSGGDRLVLALADDSPWRRVGYLRPESDAVSWVRPDGSGLRLVRFGGEVVEQFAFAGESPVVLLRSFGQLRVVAVGPEGSPTELLSAPAAASWSLRGLGDGTALFVLSTDGGRARVWVLGPGAREAKGGTWSLGGKMISFFGDTDRDVGRTFPLPLALRAPGDTEHYLSWSFASRVPWVYAVVTHATSRTRDVFARDPEHGEWRSVVRGLAADPRGQAEGSTVAEAPCEPEALASREPLWLCRDGVVIETRNDVRGGWIVHDARSGRALSVVPRFIEHLTPVALQQGDLAIQAENLARVIDQMAPLGGALSRTVCLSDTPPPGAPTGAPGSTRGAPPAECQDVEGAKAGDRAFVLRPGAAELEVYALGGRDDFGIRLAPIGLVADGLAYSRAKLERVGDDRNFVMQGRARRRQGGSPRARWHGAGVTTARPPALAAALTGAIRPPSRPGTRGCSSSCRACRASAPWSRPGRAARGPCAGSRRGAARPAGAAAPPCGFPTC